MARQYAQGNLYVVELDENDWYLQGDEDRDLWRKEARKAAIAAKCTVVTIMVTPDVIFSMCSNPKKHRVFEERIEPEALNYAVQPMLTGSIDPALFRSLKPAEQQRLVSEIRDVIVYKANGVSGRYIIFVGVTIVEQGRV